jgi:predicted ATP-grasp superfamily ATP-dependent carboligase
MSARGTVLITDGEQRAALAATRSLGRAGYAVYVCSPRARSLAGASRYAHSEATVPDPLADASSYASAVKALVQRWKIDVVLPISEASVLALLPIRAGLGATIPFPDEKVFRRICDKAAVMQAAGTVGIAAPQQRVVNGPHDDVDGLRFPVVLKPARSVIDVGTERIKLVVQYAEDAGALSRKLGALPAAAYPVLLQERIAGAGMGVFLLLWHDEVIASFCHRRIREKPPSGGVSVYRESVAPDQALIDRSIALLRALEWQGVAMVEYKLDEASGTPYIMEINGRLWGSLQLAIDAGVDFPALLIAAARGRNVTPVHTYRHGVRSRWLLGDFDHLLARVRRSRRYLALPDDAPGRLRACLDFLTGFAGREEVLRPSDPRPALREALDWLRRR